MPPHVKVLPSKQAHSILSRGVSDPSSPGEQGQKQVDMWSGSLWSAFPSPLVLPRSSGSNRQP